MVWGDGWPQVASKARKGFESLRAEEKGTVDSTKGVGGAGGWKGCWLCGHKAAPAFGKATPGIIQSPQSVTLSLPGEDVGVLSGQGRGQCLPHIAALWLICLFIPFYVLTLLAG